MAKTLKELQARKMEIVAALKELDDALTAENRSATEKEAEELRSLEKEYEGVERSLRIAAMSSKDEDLRALADSAREFRVTTEKAKAGALLRSFLTSGSKTHAEMELRASGMITAADVAGIVPVSIGDFIEPLEKGLILDKLGIKMLTGLSGDYKYPVIPYIEAKIANRDVAVDDTTFNIDALAPNPQRTTINVPVQYWALTQSDNVLYDIVVRDIAQSVSRVLNRWMFQPTAIVPGVPGAMAYDAEKNAIKQMPLSAVPTYKELMAMPGAVEATGAYDDGTFAFVMSAKMAAILRATPVNDGDKMILGEDGKIGGYPVYLSEFVESTGNNTFNSNPLHVGFGRWSDVKVGQFGAMRMLIDPYSQSNKDAVVVRLHADFSVDVIRKGSFVIGTITA